MTAGAAPLRSGNRQRCGGTDENGGTDQNLAAVQFLRHRSSSVAGNHTNSKSSLRHSAGLGRDRDWCDFESKRASSLPGKTADIGD
jgi:hypothetical protein